MRTGDQEQMNIHQACSNYDPKKTLPILSYKGKKQGSKKIGVQKIIKKCSKRSKHEQKGGIEIESEIHQRKFGISVGDRTILPIFAAKKVKSKSTMWI